jgi:hypothetical protein
MATETLEKRVANLEQVVALILTQEEKNTSVAKSPWWEKHFGAFKDDPHYEEAMRLAREMREAEPYGDTQN